MHSDPLPAFRGTPGAAHSVRLLLVAECARTGQSGRVDSDPSVEPLVSILEEFDEDVVALVSREVAFEAGSLTMNLDVRSEGTIHSRWQVRCDGVVEHRVSLGSYDWLSVEADHVLLLDHIGRRVDLFFTIPAADPMKVVGMLTTSHEGAAGSWRPMSRYLNSLVPLHELLQESSGKLASGPASLLARYDEALRFCGMRTSILDAGPPKRWDDVLRWVETDRDLRVLILPERGTSSLPGHPLGSFVIARAFDASGPC